MKTKFIKKVTWSLWSEEAGSMVDCEFFVTIDLDKLPIKMMQKARHGKGAKATALGGAIVVTVAT